MDLGNTCRTCLRSDGTLSPLVVSITPKVGSVSSGVVDLWKIYTRLLVINVVFNIYNQNMIGGSY